MKAAVCRAFGAPLEIEELRLDPPEAGEVRVRVAACAICHSDIHFAEGAWGGTFPRSPATRRRASSKRSGPV